MFIFQNAVKRRDLTLAETQRAQSKFEKQEKLEKTGQVNLLEILPDIVFVYCIFPL